MRWCIAFFLVLGCADDSSGSDASSTEGCPPGQDNCPGTSGSSGSTTNASTGASGSNGSSGGVGTSTNGSTGAGSSTGPATSGTLDGGSSSGGMDCEAPADCETCWACAKAGPCMGTYDACLNQFNCTPSLTCVESMCTSDGLLQECVDTCCMSCAMLGTCPDVDTAISCVEQQCADLCGDVTCS